MTLNEIMRLIEDHTQESLYLEFKHGAALSKQEKSKAELVKDITAFANAAGGRIIYGISEEKNKTTGISHASLLAPVSTSEINKEWISQVIKDNTSPRFHAFDIGELPIDGGRIIVVDVQQGGTAHQNLFDHRYYQRAGVTTSPLQDFQIRDLMARGLKPEADIRLIFPLDHNGTEHHRYSLRIEIENTGSVSLENWWLTLYIPKFLLDVHFPASHDSMRFHPLFHVMAKNKEIDGRPYISISMGDPYYGGRRLILHPTQIQELWNRAIDMPPFCIEVNSENYQILKSHPPITWKLFLQNAQPLEGSVPMEAWCRF